MKVSRQQAEQNRATLLETAARLYREHGFDGIGVAQIAQAAGLTHGGVYAHFESKEDFIAQACEHAFESGLDKLDRAAAQDRAAVNRFVKHYLSETHRDASAEGCPIVALAADSTRSGGAVGTVMADGIERYVDLFEQVYQTPDAREMSTGSSDSIDSTGSSDSSDSSSDASAKPTAKAAREQAVATFAMMAGALMLARATAEDDPALSRKILSVVKARIGRTLA